MIKKSLIVILIFFIFLLNSACSWNKNDDVNISSSPGFALYLVKDISASKAIKMDIKKLVLEDEPVITDRNISSYIWNKHKINLIKDEKPQGRLSPFTFLFIKDFIYY